MGARDVPCSQAEKHTPCPDGYLAWHSWAEKKMKTHRQIVCPGCGLYKIWVSKKRRATNQNKGWMYDLSQRHK